MGIETTFALYCMERIFCCQVGTLTDDVGNGSLQAVTKGKREIFEEEKRSCGFISVGSETPGRNSEELLADIMS